MTTSTNTTTDRRPLPAEDIAIAAAHLECHAIRLDSLIGDVADRGDAGVAADGCRARAARLYDIARGMGEQRNAAVAPVDQVAAAERIIDALPEHGLTVGEGLSILAVALDTLGALDPQPPVEGDVQARVPA